MKSSANLAPRGGVEATKAGNLVELTETAGRSSGVPGKFRTYVSDVVVDRFIGQM